MEERKKEGSSSGNRLDCFNQNGILMVSKERGEQMKMTQQERKIQQTVN